MNFASFCLCEKCLEAERRLAIARAVLLRTAVLDLAAKRRSAFDRRTHSRLLRRIDAHLGRLFAAMPRREGEPLN